MKNTLHGRDEILANYESIQKLVRTDDEKKYLDGISEQHFKPEKGQVEGNIGSCIYAESCPDAFSALELVADKLGKDDKAEREKLIAKGAPASSMVPFAKYYMIEGIRGQMRVVPVSKLDDNTIVELVKSSKGAPSVVIAAKDLPADYSTEVNFGTVIVGGADAKGRASLLKEGEPAGDTVWTMYAGFPTPMMPYQKDDKNQPVRAEDGSLRAPDSFGWKYGDKLTVAEVKAKLGPDFHISII